MINKYATFRAPLSRHLQDNFLSLVQSPFQESERLLKQAFSSTSLDDLAVLLARTDALAPFLIKMLPQPAVSTVLSKLCSVGIGAPRAVANAPTAIFSPTCALPLPLLLSLPVHTRMALCHHLLERALPSHLDDKAAAVLPSPALLGTLAAAMHVTRMSADLRIIVQLRLRQMAALVQTPPAPQPTSRTGQRITVSSENSEVLYRTFNVALDMVQHRLLRVFGRPAPSFLYGIIGPLCEVMARTARQQLFITAESAVTAFLGGSNVTEGFIRMAVKKVCARRRRRGGGGLIRECE